MENQIFGVESTFWKSLAIKDGELWLSQNRLSDLGKFESDLQKTGMMKSAYSYPLSSISEVSFNEASESVKIKYQDEKGKQKKLNVGFGDENLSNQFGQYLGEKLGMARSQKEEKQLKPMLLSLLFLVLTIGVTIVLATTEDTNDLADGASRRNRNNGAILKVIVDTVGQTGVIIIGSLISLFLIYKIYDRYSNPANEVVYQK